MRFEGTCYWTSLQEINMGFLDHTVWTVRTEYEGIGESVDENQNRIADLALNPEAIQSTDCRAKDCWLAKRF